jgi:hypothetical protein
MVWPEKKKKFFRKEVLRKERTLQQQWRIEKVNHTKKNNVLEVMKLVLKQFFFFLSFDDNTLRYI